MKRQDFFHATTLSESMSSMQLMQLYFQKRLLIFQVSFVCQVVGSGRGWELHKDSKQLLVEKERGIISNCRRMRCLEFFWKSFMDFTVLQLLYLYCKLSHSEPTLQQFLSRKFTHHPILRFLQFFHFFVRRDGELLDSLSFSTL